MIIEGAIIDGEGVRAGYVRLSRGRVVEVGRPGTSSRGARETVRHGIVFPAPLDGHTHLGDSVASVEPPHRPVEELVVGPRAWKFRLLAEHGPSAKRRAMRAALRRLAREGVAGTIDFREEGLPGVRLLREAARGLGLRVVALGRPLTRPLDLAELRRLLEVADGVGLSSAGEETAAFLAAVSRECHRRGKRFAVHASEAVREEPELYLRPRPDLLVHLTAATAGDLRAVAEAGVTVASCPRSNALFGRRPPLAAFEKAGIRLMLGTDNVMFQAPSMWDELGYAYLSARAAGEPVSPAYLARAAVVEPWRWLTGRTPVLGPDSEVPVRLARLPPGDAAYQLVTRSAEHLIARAAPVGRRRSR